VSGSEQFNLYFKKVSGSEFTNREELEGLPLAKMYPIVIKSRDGLNLVSYYTLPVEKTRDGHPDEPLPMVLAVTPPGLEAGGLYGLFLALWDLPE
jgi:hypothetical protein